MKSDELAAKGRAPGGAPIVPDEALALCELNGSWGVSVGDLGRSHRA